MCSSSGFSRVSEGFSVSQIAPLKGYGTEKNRVHCSGPRRFWAVGFRCRLLLRYRLEALTPKTLNRKIKLSSFSMKLLTFLEPGDSATG